MIQWIKTIVQWVKCHLFNRWYKWGSFIPNGDYSFHKCKMCDVVISHDDFVRNRHKVQRQHYMKFNRKVI